MSWEETLLRCLALLRCPPKFASRTQVAKAAIGFLIAFDTYARGGEILLALFKELRRPIPLQQGSARHWTLNMFPMTAGAVSKTRRSDLLKAVGGSNARRSWLSQLCPLLSRSRKEGDLTLLQLVGPMYVRLFHASGVLAACPRRVPHQLRHGGASADAIGGCSDLMITERGSWSSVKSVQRYRSEGRYMRALHQLTAVQLVEAERAPTEFLRSCRLYL